MSNTRHTSAEFTSNDLSGCEAMEKLWQRAMECNLTEPGIAGTPSRVNNFVTCRNVEQFMRLSAIKCWEERTKSGANPYTLFTPLDISAGSNKQSGFSSENTAAAAANDKEPGQSTARKP